jgi:hypothetical protein
VSAYPELLRLAQAQSAALARGDLEAAVGMLEARGAVLARAGAPGPSDLDVIREVLRLDRDLSGAIRERMLEIRQQALDNQRGRRALSGYGRGPAQAARTIDRVS